ncbi:MAG: hypothetical protein EPO32_01830 [Anaerolineae bacterium]|nr:MAG: hypothetical protein EPO32_01830 [Anaerolineae bacterium]
MPSSKFLRTASWAAYLTAAATIISLISLIVFFSLIPTLGTENIFGPINDFTSIVLAFLGAFVAYALYLSVEKQSPGPAKIGVTLMLIGNLILGTIQTLFMLDIVPLSATTYTGPFGVALAGLGLILLSRAQSSLSTRLVRIMWIAATSGILVLLAGLITGWDSGLTSIFGLVYIVFNTAWLVGVGRYFAAKAG